MTKSVRIENADTADYKLKVIVQVKTGGEWVSTGEIYNLDYATAQLNHSIWEGKRLIIEENGSTEYTFTDKRYIKRLEDTIKKELNAS